MDALTTQTSRLFSRLSVRASQSIVGAQRCEFQTKAASHADTSTIFKTSPMSRSRTAHAATLALDNPLDALGGTERERNARRTSSEMFEQTNARNMERARLRNQNMAVERLQSRSWQPGDLYTPHDLVPNEIKKFRLAKRPTKDIFDALGINPINEYKNPVLLAEFMTSAGKIKHPRETGLRPVNQRKVAKAIRRAIGMGIMPSCHVHPEMLRRYGPDSRTWKYVWT